ncbi:MAG TPA: ABC transporter permease, partial [Bryobacteraceae bacterium]|nr:ABC transporter permease [Bryobacteraceae bacterium]
MLKDLKFALRQLRKSPAFAITAILTLAIGIGANTAIFSTMDAIVLRPLAIPDMNRVVTVYDAQNSADDYPATTLGNYEDWARQSRSFQDLAAHANESLTLTGAGDAAHVQASAVSPNFFGLLRIGPLMGRVFRPDEGRPGRDGEAVLSYSFWRRHFGGDPDVVGRRIELDDRAYTVIGVMPETFGYPSDSDLFLPLAATPQQMENRAARDYFVIGRLRPGVSVQAAQAEMEAIAARLAKLYPATNLGWKVKVTPLLDNINGTLTPLYMRMMISATLFVLLIVCANLANLQFARGLRRHNEMAVRTALGAQRFRLLRQLLAESVLLGLVGAAGGLLLAKLDLQILVNTMPPLIARYIAGWNHVSLNGRALALSLALAVGAGVISGLAPALESLRLNLVDQLKTGGRTSTGSARTHRLRNVFVVAQIALAVTLVIGATLMVKGLDAMSHRSDVYGPKRILTFNVSLPAQHYGTPQKQAEWYADSLGKVQSLPGVKSAVITTVLPEGGDGTWNDSFRLDHRPVVPGQIQNAARVAVSTGYFSALHIPVVEGRAFTTADGLNTTPVAVVSRGFAAHYFPGASALGHKIRFGEARDSSDPWVTIVGVAADVRYQWTDNSPEPAIYLNAAQLPPSGAKYAVITEGDPLAVASDVRRALAALDPGLPLDAMQTYAEYVREGLIGLTNATWMLAVDAAIALLLAGIGIFGVMANLVGERRREIGVRLTMGARPEDVLRMFLRRAAVLAGIGLAI